MCASCAVLCGGREGPSEQCVSDVLFAPTVQGTAGGSTVGSPPRYTAVLRHRTPERFSEEQDQEAAVGSCAEAMAEAD